MPDYQQPGYPGDRGGLGDDRDHQHGQQQPPRWRPTGQNLPRRKRWPWVVAAVIAAIALFAALGDDDDDDDGDDDGRGAQVGNELVVEADSGGAKAAPPESDASVNTVVYKVTGSGTASSITYTTDGMMTTNQESNVKLPWAKTIELPDDEAIQVVQVLAQGNGSGKIDATITVNGKQVKQAHADGYGIASASHEIGTLGG